MRVRLWKGVPTLRPGDVISYIDMCRAEGVSLQRGMNFGLGKGASVLLMSVRRGAPYADRVEDDGRTIVYEGHDAPRRSGGPDPKTTDQPEATPSGRPTQNALFHRAARRHAEEGAQAELVRVYEKIRQGIWTFNGLFALVDAWREGSGGRMAYKFRLRLCSPDAESEAEARDDIEHTRVIPAAVKLTVWERDGGKCVVCGSRDNLHFDHIIPFSKGGSSLVPDNIQLLCARHNLAKHDRIE